MTRFCRSSFHYDSKLHPIAMPIRYTKLTIADSTSFATPVALVKLLSIPLCGLTPRGARNHEYKTRAGDGTLTIN